MKATSFAVVIVLGISAGAWAQEASTVPVSDRWIVMKVEAWGTPATVKVQDGGLARLRQVNGDLVYGVTPVAEGGGFKLVLFEIIGGPRPGVERMRHVEERQVTQGVAVVFKNAQVPLSVTVNGVQDKERAPGEPTAPCIRCCVRCDGVEACACEVLMDCGQCCCDSPACGACIWEN